MEITDELRSMVPDLGKLKDPTTVQEVIEQQAIISKALERCEKTMQYLAMGHVDGEELAKYTATYKQLIAYEQQLGKRRQELAAAEYRAEKQAQERAWWKFW